MDKMKKLIIEKLFQKIKADLNLDGWRIRFMHNGEGFCWREQKIIDIGLKSKNIKILLLHEIAHINNIEEKNQHSQNWYNTFKELKKQYCRFRNMDKSDKILIKLYGLN